MTDTISAHVPHAGQPDSGPLLPWATEDEIARQIRHDLQSNYHYDMPVEVWQYIIGPSMKYSCGLWDAQHATLEAAQEANLIQVVESLNLTPESHVLDVGAGWGAFTIFASKRTGCRVTGIGLAPRAVEYAREWARRERVDHLVDVRVNHVLALPESPGTFSHVVFLETFEHMRLKRETIAGCRRTMKVGGTLYMQVIGVKNPSYHQKALGSPGTEHIYKNYGDVGDPVPLSTVVAALEENNFEVMDLHSITAQYPATLRAWAENTRTHSKVIDELTEPGRSEELRKYFMLGWLGYSQGVGVNHQIWAHLHPEGRD
jgi:cyclopropane-fatty-acyl-phospholipid synthase